MADPRIRHSYSDGHAYHAGRPQAPQETIHLQHGGPHLHDPRLRSFKGPQSSSLYAASTPENNSKLTS